MIPATNQIPVRDGLSASPFLNFPKDVLGRIGHYCTMQDVGRLARTCAHFHEFFSAQALRNATELPNLRALGTRLITDQSAETKDILIRYNALPEELRAQLPTDVQDLARAVQQTLHHGQAKKLEAFLDCRDNLIFWKKMNAADNKNRSIDFYELQTADAYFQKYALLNKTPINRLTIDLSNLSLTSIPKDLFRYTPACFLHFLNLTHNHLTSLPPEFEHLISLEQLGLGDNHLTSLPPEFGQLPRLEWLELDSDHLAILPCDLGSFQKLQGLKIDETRYQGKALQNFIRSLPPRKQAAIAQIPPTPRPTKKQRTDVEESASADSAPRAGNKEAAAARQE